MHAYSASWRSFSGAGERGMRAALVTRALIAGALLVALTSAVGCARQEPTAEDARLALRVLRLAGFSGASVGANGSTALVTVELPASAGAADVELAWQTAISTMSVAYPDAPRYAVRFELADGRGLEVGFDGDEARSAVAADDPGALRTAAEVAFDAGAEASIPLERLSSVETSVDAENRSAGLVVDGRVSVQGYDALSRAWRDARASAPGVPAPEGGSQAAARAAAARIAKALGRSEIEGAEALSREVRRLLDEVAVPDLRQIAAITEAVASRSALGSVLRLTAAAARDVRDRGVGTQDDGAVRDLAREPSLDTTGTPVGDALPNQVLARVGEKQADGTYGVAWSTAGGGDDLAAPEHWLAYRAPDGTVYWLAGADGEVALVDRSFPGWAWNERRAELVDADDTALALLSVALQ